LLQARPPALLRLSDLLKDRPGLRRLTEAPFVPDRLRSRAMRRAGLSDFGPDDYEAGLDRLCASIETDADLHPLGRIILKQRFVQALVTRLRWVQARQQLSGGHTVRRPTFVLGLPRTGTTLLHRLLSLAGDARALRLWELIQPLHGGTDRARRRSTLIQLGLFKRLAPGVDAKHFVSADSHEECWPLMLPSFCSHGFWTQAPVKGYMDWLEGQDAEPTYRMYRELLSLVTADTPDKRLVLKYPSHTPNLSVLAQVFPEANIVQTHRDPKVVVASICSLMHTGHRTVSNVDAATDAQWELQRLGSFADGIWPQRDALAPGRVFDVHYDDLVADPVGQALAVHEHFGLPIAQGFERKLRSRMENRPKNKYGRHEYSLERVGLDADAVDARFAGYWKRAPLPRQGRQPLLHEA
jgi:hypothetical protein